MGVGENFEDIFTSVLNMTMTRREFLKYSTMAFIPIIFRINVFNRENLSNRMVCKNCGAINKDMRVYFFDWLMRDSVRYCYNCGIDLSQLRYKVVDKSQHKEKIKNRKVGRGYYTSPVYYNVPFPNHKYLVKTNKPSFTISDLNF